MKLNIDFMEYICNYVYQQNMELANEIIANENVHYNDVLKCIPSEIDIRRGLENMKTRHKKNIEPRKKS
jgi:hypothetical protein